MNKLTFLVFLFLSVNVFSEADGREEYISQFKEHLNKKLAGVVEARVIKRIGKKAEEIPDGYIDNLVQENLDSMVSCQMLFMDAFPSDYTDVAYEQVLKGASFDKAKDKMLAKIKKGLSKGNKELKLALTNALSLTNECLEKL